MSRARNSNIELLRIIGIVLILLNHTLQNDLLPATAFPWSFASSLLARLGGLGDVIFFGITACFMSQSGGGTSLRGQLRRVWVLERQLLVYSLGLFLMTFAAWFAGFGFNSYDASAMLSLGIMSLLPLSSKLWWYPSAYAVFLVALPFLNMLLRRMGESVHRAIAATLFVLCSVPPSSILGPLSLGWTPALFVYQYVVFSYVAWYMRLDKAILSRLALAAALLAVIGPLISGLTGADVSGGYLNLPQSMPSMVLGFSLVLLAVGAPLRCNGAINRVASCAFAAYLIQCYPSGLLVVSKAVGVVADLTGELWVGRILLEALIALGVLAVAVVVDSLRQAVFSMTVDSRKGRYFDRIWEFVERKFVSDGEMSSEA